MKKYLVFIIQGYESEVEGKLSDVVIIELIDTSLEEALKRAKTLTNKSHYRLTSIIEKFEE